MKKHLITFLIALVLSSPSLSHAQDVPTDQQRIERLEQDLKAALARIDSLEQQVALLKQAPPAKGQKPAKPPEEPAAAANTTWHGTLVWAGSNEKATITATITDQTGTHFTLRTETERGAVWDWDCTSNGTAVQVVAIKRIKAAPGPGGNPAMAGITGSGSLSKDQLLLKIDWPQAGNIKHGTFALRKQ
jgi:hypothetical protein